MILPRLRLPLLLAWLSLPSATFAHQLDEYLQSTLVVIDPATIRLQIILTPGVAVAEQMIALMDRDTDGIISSQESTAYAELLKHDLSVQLDARDLALKLIASDIPTPAELRTGAGIVQVEFSAVPGAPANGLHTLALKNGHFPSVGIYLLNAAKPKSGTIQIIRQTRNEKQSAGEIEFTFQPPANPSRCVGYICALVGLLVAFFVGGWALLHHRRVNETRCM
jgi:hypothetical protein